MVRTTQSMAMRGAAVLFAALFALLLAVGLSSVAMPGTAYADTLRDRGAEVDKAEVDEIDLKNVDSAVGKASDDSTEFPNAVDEWTSADGKASSAVDMVNGVTYSITYKDGVSWGKKLTVIAEVTMVKDGRYYEGHEGEEDYLLHWRHSKNANDADVYTLIKEGDDDFGPGKWENTVGQADPENGNEVINIVGPAVRVYQAKDGRLAVSWTRTQHTQVEWKVTTVDSSGNEVGTPLLTGVVDPDESDYLFDTTATSLFYVLDDNDNPNVPDRFEVDDNGVYPIASTDPDTGEITHGAINFENAKLLMSMSNKASFTWTTDTYASGYLATPYFYSPVFRVTYDLDGGDGTGVNDPDNPDHYKAGESYDIKEPTRPGWVFVRWDRVDEDGNPVPHDKIDDTDARDLHFIARWKRVDTYEIEKIRVLGVGETEEADTKLIPGAPAYYLITLTNTGEVDIPAGLEVIDQPQMNLEPTDAYTESGSAEVSDGEATWTVGEIPAGESVQMWVTSKVLLDATEKVANKATAHDPDNPDDPGKTDETEDPLYEFKIEKTANVDKAAVGSEITYTIKVYNESDYDAPDMIIKDVLGDGLEYISDNGGGTNEGKTTTWVRDLPANTVTTITLKAKVAKTPENGVAENVAAIMDPANPEKELMSAGTLASDDAKVDVAGSVPQTGDFGFAVLLAVVVAGGVVLLARRKAQQ